ncbi:MAG: VOC family protein [Xanthomonadaceae bacterium]|nr:VOC family protein [Xanthomonadaceae bacterium]
MLHSRHNAVNWFEIPVADLDRAQRFYETLFATPLQRGPADDDGALVVFPFEKYGVGGCLRRASDGPKPSCDGATVYLNAVPSLDTVLARVESAGGSVALPRTELPAGMGCFAHVIDSEGNRVGLHALQ